MGKGLIGSLALLLAGAGLSYGQPGGPMGGPPMGFPPGGPGPMAMPGMPPEGFSTMDGRPVLPPPGLEGALHPSYMQPGPYAPYGSGQGILEGGGEAPVFWMRGDYLLWQPKSFNPGVAFASTSAVASRGVLGAPTTVPLFGTQNVNYGTGSGFRLLSGFAFDESSGFEMNGFWMESLGKSFNVNSSPTGSPLLAVPFFNNATQANGSYFLSTPAGQAGGVLATNQIQTWGAGGDVVFHLLPSTQGSTGFDILVGARFIQMSEQFSLGTFSSNIAGPTGVFGNSFGALALGTFAGSATGLVGTAPFSVFTNDQVKTLNHFYGGDVGFRFDSGLGRFTFSATGKFAAGVMRQRVDINSTSTFNATGGSTTALGGIFFDGNEVGRRTKDRFAMVPEGNIDIGFQVTQRMRVHVGYSFMWMSSVIRPSSIVSGNVNPSLMPVSPTFTGAAPVNFQARDLARETDFWLQGVNFGFAFQF